MKASQELIQAKDFQASLDIRERGFLDYSNISMSKPLILKPLKAIKYNHHTWCYNCYYWSYSMTQNGLSWSWRINFNKVPDANSISLRVAGLFHLYSSSYNDDPQKSILQKLLRWIITCSHGMLVNSRNNSIMHEEAFEQSTQVVFNCCFHFKGPMRCLFGLGGYGQIFLLKPRILWLRMAL